MFARRRSLPLSMSPTKIALLTCLLSCCLWAAHIDGAASMSLERLAIERGIEMQQQHQQEVHEKTMDYSEKQEEKEEMMMAPEASQDVSSQSALNGDLMPSDSESENENDLTVVPVADGQSDVYLLVPASNSMPEHQQQQEHILQSLASENEDPAANFNEGYSDMVMMESEDAPVTQILELPSVLMEMMEESTTQNAEEEGEDNNKSVPSAEKEAEASEEPSMTMEDVKEYTTEAMAIAEAVKQIEKQFEEEDEMAQMQMENSEGMQPMQHKDMMMELTPAMMVEEESQPAGASNEGVKVNEMQDSNNPEMIGVVMEQESTESTPLESNEQKDAEDSSSSSTAEQEGMSEELEIQPIVVEIPADAPPIILEPIKSSEEAVEEEKVKQEEDKMEDKPQISEEMKPMQDELQTSEDSEKAEEILETTEASMNDEEAANAAAEESSEKVEGVAAAAEESSEKVEEVAAAAEADMPAVILTPEAAETSAAVSEEMSVSEGESSASHSDEMAKDETKEDYNEGLMATETPNAEESAMNDEDSQTTEAAMEDRVQEMDSAHKDDMSSPLVNNDEETVAEETSAADSKEEAQDDAHQAGTHQAEESQIVEDIIKPEEVQDMPAAEENSSTEASESLQHSQESGSEMLNETSETAEEDQHSGQISEESKPMEISQEEAQASGEQQQLEMSQEVMSAMADEAETATKTQAIAEIPAPEEMSESMSHSEEQHMTDEVQPSLEELKPVESEMQEMNAEDMHSMEDKEEMSQETQIVEDTQAAEETLEAKPTQVEESKEDSKPMEESPSMEEIQTLEKVEEVQPVNDIQDDEETTAEEVPQSLEIIQPVMESQSLEATMTEKESENMPANQATEPEHMVEMKPAEETEIMEDTKPTNEVEIMEDTKPADETETMEDIKPAEAESMEQAQPIEEVEKIEESKPAEEVVAEAILADEIEHVDEAKPSNEIESKPLAESEESKPADETETMEESKPADAAEEMEESKPVDAAEEMQESKPADDIMEESKPAAEDEVMDAAISAVETDTMEEVKPVEEAQPSEESESMEEAKPIEEAQAMEEAKPMEEAQAMEEAKPMEEAQAMEETKPVDDIVLMDEVKPAEETRPMEDVKEEAPIVDEIQPMEEEQKPNQTETMEDESKPVEPMEEDKPANQNQSIEEIKPAQEVEQSEESKSQSAEETITPQLIENIPMADEIQVTMIEQQPEEKPLETVVQEETQPSQPSTILADEESLQTIDQSEQQEQQTPTADEIAQQQLADIKDDAILNDDIDNTISQNEQEQPQPQPQQQSNDKPQESSLLTTIIQVPISAQSEEPSIATTAKPLNVMDSGLNYVNGSFINLANLEQQLQNEDAPFSAQLRRYDGAQVWRIVVQNDRERKLADELQSKFDGQLWKEVKQEVDYLLKPQVLFDAERHVRAANLSRIVLIDNLQQAIEVENPPAEEIAQLQNRKGHRLTWQAYHRLEDIHGFFDYLAKTYPDICSVETIGYSVQKRPLKILKISNGNPTNAGIWIDGGMHAREWISPAVVTYIANQLVEGWDDLPNHMRSINWYIHAVANPDGYEYSHTTDRLWRKNMRSHGRACPGVDLNRNFGYKWGGKGTSANPCAQTYRGSKAFSEPETFYISKYISNFPRNTFKAYLTFHSYGQYILYPWGYDYHITKDMADLDLVARQAGTTITRRSGVKYTVGSSANTLYPAAGGSDDWAKGFAEIKYSYTIEMGDTGRFGFVLPASHIEPNGKDGYTFVETVARAITMGKNARRRKLKAKSHH